MQVANLDEMKKCIIAAAETTPAMLRCICAESVLG
jgi:hypothetical protein